MCLYRLYLPTEYPWVSLAYLWIISWDCVSPCLCGKRSLSSSPSLEESDTSISPMSTTIIIPVNGTISCSSSGWRHRLFNLRTCSHIVCWASGAAVSVIIPMDVCPRAFVWASPPSCSMEFVHPTQSRSPRCSPHWTTPKRSIGCDSLSKCCHTNMRLEHCPH